MDHARMDVLGIGSATWDRFLVVPRFPQPNDKLQVIRTEEWTGGVVAAASAALARWGLRTRLVTAMAPEPYAARVRADLAAEGVDVVAFERPLALGDQVGTIVVDNRNGDRFVLNGHRGALPLEPADLKPELFDGARVLHLDTSADECALEAVEAAQRRGMFIVAAAERMESRTWELLRRSDDVIATLDFAREATQQERPSRAADALSLQARRPVVVTDGPRGYYFADDQQWIDQRAIDGPVVDRSGAGYVFQTAFLYGLLAAWEVRRILKFAAWAAAETCREIGGRKGIPSLADVHDFLRRRHES